MDLQAQERERTERAQMERPRLGGGGMGTQLSEQRTQSGIFEVGLGKPAPKLDDNIGNFFTWTRQKTYWGVSNTCEDAF